jgi:hypothetical protein
MPLDERRMDRTVQPTDPGNRSWVAAEAAMTDHNSLKSSGTSPNLFSTTASENSPMFGSPVRLNATAPAIMRWNMVSFLNLKGVEMERVI